MNPDQTTITEVTEQEDWTTPILKKMDIEETAISEGNNFDGDGFS